MKRFRTFIRTLRRLSAPMKVLVGIAILLAGVMSFSMGVGGATITQAAMAATGNDQSRPQPILIEQADAVKNPTTLRVEIVRGGEVIRAGTAPPSIAEVGLETRYSLEKPVANCPPLSSGDTVRSTWIQSSEVNISSLGN